MILPIKHFFDTYNCQNYLLKMNKSLSHQIWCFSHSTSPQQALVSLNNWKGKEFTQSTEKALLYLIAFDKMPYNI